MQKRKLGSSNLEVSALGLGCMRMTFGDAPIGPRQKMIEFLHKAVEWLEQVSDEQYQKIGD